MYAALDVFFFVFHTALTLFNLVGWAWRRTRRVHLATITLTLLSWTALGFVYGFGYCPCTDWHWQVKRRLGATDLPASYVKFYLDRLTGLDLAPALVDAGVVVCAVAAFALSVALNVRDARRTRNMRRV